MKQDLIGQVFTRAKVIGVVRKNSTLYYSCYCDPKLGGCGKFFVTKAYCLIYGCTKSCGCYKQEQIRLRSTTHGLSKHPLFKVWVSMKNRCFNLNEAAYKYYGGKGVVLCNAWKEDFKKFYDWGLSTGYQKGLSIDRIDNNGNYEPSNCRWATDLQQARNVCSNVYIDYNGEHLCKSELLEKYGKVGEKVFSKRLKRGWSIKDALETPSLRWKTKERWERENKNKEEENAVSE